MFSRMSAWLVMLKASGRWSTNGGGEYYAGRRGRRFGWSRRGFGDH